ncbi:uncharacterized protein DUF4190 [Sediminihabitans luteus]|uniref:Uncharacterized protein DUF4190 n=1 Tax=Sediminihabitans luteus TaxID=1138585 RepID=A0A2M9D0E4_9CELL|nr:DUF4190 domain-containing protein [Sediminihabitans luteus]PJJ77662.1 uncharacterized protein DUF4190 [Sediminihabitans luteus]GII98562.1 hypothetical protein Slu03_09400 [Sediminihabitans luteus]
MTNPYPPHDPYGDDTPPNPYATPAGTGGTASGTPASGTPPYGGEPAATAPYGTPPYGQAPYGQAPYGQAPYGQAPYGQGQAPYGQQPVPGHYGYPYAPAKRPTSGLAIASMVTSIAGFVIYAIPAVVGLVLGIVALRQIKRDGLEGRGMAIAGVVIGAAGIAIWVIFVGLWGLLLSGTSSY